MEKMRFQCDLCAIEETHISASSLRSSVGLERLTFDQVVLGSIPGVVGFFATRYKQPNSPSPPPHCFYGLQMHAILLHGSHTLGGSAVVGTGAPILVAHAFARKRQDRVWVVCLLAQSLKSQRFGILAALAINRRRFPNTLADEGGGRTAISAILGVLYSSFRAFRLRRTIRNWAFGGRQGVVTN